MARPTKYTDALADEIVLGIAAGLTKTDAALAAGIDPKTMDAWVGRYPDFSRRLARAKAQRTRTWLAGIRKAATDEAGRVLDWRAYAELLDRCAPEYRKTANVDVTHSGTVRHEHAALDAAVEAIAAERGLDPAAVLAEAEAILTGGDG